MRRSFAFLLLMVMFGNGRADASMCSSRDGQKYCTCEYNQTCTSSENSCACVRGGGELQTPALVPPPPSTHLPVIRDTPRREPAHSTPAPPPAPALPPSPAAQAPAAPAPIDNDERTPAEYVHLAQAAVAAGRVGAAIEFIDKGQTRLLDRSVALNKTFDPISDEPIKQLSLAKQALLAKNRDRATKSLDAALASMK
jgi:hypothetical protein